MPHPTTVPRLVRLSHGELLDLADAVDNHIMRLCDEAASMEEPREVIEQTYRLQSLHAVLCSYLSS